MLRIDNTLIGRQTNNGKSKTLLLNILPGTGKPPWKMCLENAFGNNCDKGKNVNKEIFLSIKDCFVYNIVAK